MNYSDQLKHPLWQRRRLEIMQRDEFACQVCFDKDSTLHVHHKHYIKGRMAWEYADDELVTLCEPCHGFAHEESEAWKQLLAKLRTDGPYSTGEAFALISGWAHENCGHDLSSEYNSNPITFSVGEIASLLQPMDMGVLLDLFCALRVLERKERATAIQSFAKTVLDSDA